MIHSGTKRDLDLSFELHNCRGWQQREDLTDGIMLAINHARLLPLEFSSVPVGNNKHARPVVTDLPTWFDACYHTKDEWDGVEFSPMKFQEEWGKLFRVPLEDEWQTDQPLYGAVDMLLDARRFGDPYNYLDFGCTLFGKSKFLPERASQLGYANALASVLLSFARPIIEHFKPDYAVISDSHHFATYGQDILTTKLPYIHWCNYLGQPYLQHYGEDVFRTAPGWRTEAWGDGLWYQTTEDFSSFGLEERQAIAAHFADIGVHPVGMIQYIG